MPLEWSPVDQLWFNRDLPQLFDQQFQFAQDQFVAGVNPCFVQRLTIDMQFVIQFPNVGSHRAAHDFAMFGLHTGTFNRQVGNGCGTDNAVRFGNPETRLVPDRDMIRVHNGQY